MLESGLQAAVSWASLLCVYMVAMAFQNCMLCIFLFFAKDRSSLEGREGEYFPTSSPAQRP